jgi:predicted transcriptional regulator
MCYIQHMRMHIEVDDALVDEIDRIAGERGRSAFVRRAIEAAITQEERWEELTSAAGALADRAHDWEGDPAGWVRDQRRTDARRVG